MNFVAWQMLAGDRAKYLGLIFAIAFSTFLMSHQSSIFAGIMNRTTSQIRDVHYARIWVMDAKTQNADEVKSLTDQDLFRVRGVDGVEWAVPLYKGMSRAKGPDGSFRSVILMGLDDASLVGAPRSLALGSLDGLRDPDSIIMDQVGFKFFFPGEPFALGKTLEMNDHLVRVTAIANSSAPFQNLPVFYTRYSQAITYMGCERNLMSFVLVKACQGEIPFGEMSLLVGPSGCGKTTLLSVMAGLLDASGGKLQVLGRDLSELSASASVVFRRQNLGFVFQQYNLLPALTAAENAAVPLLAAGVKRKEAIGRARDLLAQLRMEKRADALPRDLSGGQQQRLALARALVHDPRLLVCDEPTSALDAETGHAVMELLREVAVREDRAVIVVTHDNRVFDFADRIAYMDDGRIVRTEVREGVGAEEERLAMGV